MRFIFGLAAAIFVSLAAVSAAEAQSAECQRLQQAIASAGRGADPARNMKRRRKDSAARSKEPPPTPARSAAKPQIPVLWQRAAAAMRSDQRAAVAHAGQSRRSASARRRIGRRARRTRRRYNAECSAPQGPRGIFDALFGSPRDQPADVQTAPLEPGPVNPDQQQPAEGSTSEAHAGSKAVCVRSCDGSFFPVSYSAYGRLDELQEHVPALCPNAEVTLYTYSPSADIDQAVSITGAHYMDSPTALKYRKSVDNSCSCRRRGQSWARPWPAPSKGSGARARPTLW